MKKFMGIAVILFAVLGCSDGGKIAERKPQMDVIRERGVLLVGVKVDSPRMSTLNPETNEFEGMEVDIAKLLAKRMFGDENKIRIKPVTPQNRVDKLNKGIIDLTIGTFTINDDRRKLVHFSEPYFSEGLAFLVRKGDRLSRIEQLDGKKVGIAKGTAPSWPLPGMIKDRGLDIQVVEYPDYPIIVGALKRGEVDAFCTVRAALFGYLSNSLEVMEETFHPGSYGIAIKLGNQDLLDHLNAFVAELKSDGTLDGLKKKWNM
ncbi:MAG: transporter substrate-binding domain-containing protein [Candidatus Accumulibacter sp.]|jgi:putative glutamine transport system substrate-binding protein|nr:transporter substrate-binding domain-containing protein [Accumulibacter sp.]